MMGFPRSIRWRLQLWYGALLVALLGGFGFTAFHLEKTRQLRRIDDGIQMRVSALVAALQATPPPTRSSDRKTKLELQMTPAQTALFAGSDGYYFTIWMLGPAPIASSANAPALIPRPQRGDPVTRTRGDLRESFLSAAPVNHVLVGRSIAPETAEFEQLAGLLAVIGVAVLAAGLVGGWALATHAIRPVEVISATATRIAAGDLSQRIATDETDSELGRLAGVLNSTFARLEASFIRQERFTADAAHELRTPVSVILTQTQAALARERTPAEYRDTLEACQRATQRMRHLIESLLALARLDAGNKPLQREPCDLSTIVAEAIDLLHPISEERGISLHTELAEAPCRGDAQGLLQIATNLLTNAIDHNGETGEVRVLTKAVEGTALLIVSNTGPGIPDNDLPHVFERFYRSDRSRTGSHRGLGLAITHATVTAQGGTIEASSDASSRTTFTVKLPAAVAGNA